MGAFDIQGKDCVFQLKIGDDYKTVVCAKSFTFNPVTDMKETTTVGSGFWKEFRPRKLSYTITFNGMFQIHSSGTQEMIKTMFDYQIGFLPMNYRLIYTDASANVMIVNGTVYVISTLLDASPVNLVNGTVELQGNGPIEVLDQLPIPINIHIVSTGDPSIAAFIQFRLYNSNGDIVFDSGQLPAASGGNLSHPVDVVGTVQSGSYYYTWQVTADSVGNTFDLDAPPTATTGFANGTSNDSTVNVQLYDFTADRTVTFALGVPTPPPACVAPAIPGSPALPDSLTYVPYSFSFPITGSAPFNITNVTKPSWMSIVIDETSPGSGSYQVQITGTPDTTGTDIDVSFDINNACGTISFADTIDITDNPDVVTITYSFDTSVIFSIFRIFVNGSPAITPLTADGSGSINVNPGDVVQVQCVAAGTSKHTTVVDSVSGTIYNNTTSATTQSFTFTTTIGHDYTITSVI